MAEQQQEQEPARQRLEVPSTSLLERRLLVGDAAPRRTRHKPAIKAVPPSGLLGRLQSFLPSLEAANTELQQRLEVQPSAEVAMERGSDDEGEGPYVEMDLACGLFDLKDSAAVAAAERAMVNQGVAVERFEGASTDDSDSDGSGGSGEEELSDGEEGLAEAGHSRGGGLGIVDAAAGGEGGGEAMQEDEPAAAAGGAAEAGAAAVSLQQQQQRAAGSGRRRKAKQRSGRNPGIQELS